MLFIGLEVMEMAIGGPDSTLSMQLSKFSDMRLCRILFCWSYWGFFYGHHTIIHSATGVFIAFLATGVIDSIDQSFFLVMGANIGTCSDGIMASLSTNANGSALRYSICLLASLVRWHLQSF